MLLFLGVLSAAGLYGLEEVYPRLKEEHDKARILAKIINSEGRGLVTVDMEKLETNIVLVEIDRKVMTARMMVEMLSRSRWPVMALEWDTYTVRLVTHRDITERCLSLAGDTLTTVIRSAMETNKNM